MTQKTDFDTAIAEKSFYFILIKFKVIFNWDTENITKMTKISVPIGNKPLKFMWKHRYWTLILYILSIQAMVSSYKCIQLDSKLSAQYWIVTHIHVCTMHDGMMTSSNGNTFRVTGPLCGEFTDHRWIPLTKTSDADLWYFLWFAP